MIACAALIGVGSIGTWTRLHAVPGIYPDSYNGVEKWTGYGWITMGISLLIGIAALVALVSRWRDPKVIATSLMTAMGVATLILILQYDFAYSNRAVTESAGWCASTPDGAVTDRLEEITVQPASKTENATRATRRAGYRCRWRTRTGVLTWTSPEAVRPRAPQALRLPKTASSSRTAYVRKRWTLTVRSRSNST